jgi:hypothetical protein
MTACQMPHLNPGRVTAVAVGAHAGWFRRVNGRWPADLAELTQLDCPRLDESSLPEANGFDDSPRRDPRPCNVLAELPYVVALQPHARDLRLVFFKGKGQIVCTLTVLAPAAQSAGELSPLIRIRILPFSCPGEGKPF